jgi:hypothetical protein
LKATADVLEKLTGALHVLAVKNRLAGENQSLHLKDYLPIARCSAF